MKPHYASNTLREWDERRRRGGGLERHGNTVPGERWSRIESKSGVRCDMGEREGDREKERERERGKMNTKKALCRKIVPHLTTTAPPSHSTPT